MKKFITKFNYSKLNTEYTNPIQIEKIQPKIIHQKPKIPKTIT